MTEVARREELLDLDYAEVVDPNTLSVPPSIEAEVRLVIAGRVGKARLIDNLAANGAED
jgi:pantothenate synthetase